MNHYKVVKRLVLKRKIKNIKLLKNRKKESSVLSFLVQDSQNILDIISSFANGNVSLIVQNGINALTNVLNSFNVNDAVNVTESISDVLSVSKDDSNIYKDNKEYIHTMIDKLNDFYQEVQITNLSAKDLLDVID